MAITTSKKTVSKKSEQRYTEGVGRRKNAVARVRITPNTSQSFIINNNKNLDTYFPIEEHRQRILEPFAKSKSSGKYSVSVRVAGGGTSGQADAICLGISRAMIIINPEIRTKLKKADLLKRDPRIKERRKFGLKKARRAPQWSKR
jgi:small subunit ribosomal protein S9